MEQGFHIQALSPPVQLAAVWLSELRVQVSDDRHLMRVQVTDDRHPFQSHFRSGFGTQIALEILVGNLPWDKERHNVALQILWDVLVASDIIILFTKVSYGTENGSAPFQKVDLEGYCSALWQLCCCVPQESILSSPLSIKSSMPKYFRWKCGI